MQLEKLSLLNYKNFESQSFTFDAKINCFVGQNGVGKTNVLDAIYHLSFGKSYFNPITGQNMRHGSDFFVVEGSYVKNKRPEKINVSAKRGSKKILKRNAKVYEKFSEHIGFLPLVMISPADRDLILEGSDTRRKFIDGVISQADPSYLNHLIDYNKVLLQRNSLLKYFAANQTHNQDTLDIYDAQLTQYGTLIFEKRAAFLQEFMPIFLARHNVISNGAEEVSIVYKSQLESATLLSLLKNNIAKDKMMQYTGFGIHKDDLVFEIDGYPIKKFGSQGQQKSFLIALNLAQFDFIKTQAKVPPIVLLDDVFDKLDQDRVALIMQLVESNHFGQIFLSDTHQERTLAALDTTQLSYSLFELS